ncbi:uncharacterized protein N7511_011258 [Penicillium nucicola]|uniref:uncharacterized protein n=1 Tax=Penicillium nucicola TaxID=1850975 RepID=UPI002544F9B8|nr:uncharacterized protein N7511_011258 [Penicillium nucicola]KAJ5742526.1 hypothetical protein N7511_011258 [Penicillium nucicola]
MSLPHGINSNTVLCLNWPLTCKKVTSTPLSTRRRLRAGEAESILCHRFQTTGLNIIVPISKLTEGLDVPIKNMETWVARPAEFRREEVQTKGRISRPMNSFMLYRSAYTERIKKLFRVNNHRVVSKIAGQGWKFEPSAVRQKYADLAKLERDAHTAVHPEYKYSPRKQRKCATNHRKEAAWSESEFSADSTRHHMYPPHDRSLEKGYSNANQDFSPYGTLEQEMSLSWPNANYSTSLYPGSSHSLKCTTNGQVCAASHSQQNIHCSSSLVGLLDTSHPELLQPPHYNQVAYHMDPVLLVYPNASEAVEFPNIAGAIIASGTSTYTMYDDNIITDYCRTTMAPFMTGIF